MTRILPIVLCLCVLACGATTGTGGTTAAETDTLVDSASGASDVLGADDAAVAGSDATADDTALTDGTGTDVEGPDSGGNTPESCLNHTKSEGQCKDCCDCLGITCADAVKCRDACMQHDFSQNDGTLTITPPAPLGVDGDYSLCTAAGTEDACKSCCECDGHFQCGDKSHCRDACVTAGSPWPVLKMTDIGAPQLVKDTLQFAEGPVWHSGLAAWLFSDVEADTIYRLDLPATLATWRKPSNHANGLALSKDGLVLACEHATRRVTRTNADGTITVLADKWQGKPLNSPNDLVVTADGTVFFSDPTFGLGSTPSDLGFTGVYRIAPNGTLTLEAQLDGQPNGVAVSANGKSLLIALTTANKVIAYDIVGNGGLGKPHNFANVGAPDGLAVDQGGNVYVAGQEGGKNAIVVLNPIGKHIGSIPLAQQPTNCGLGGADGKTLLVTARTAVYQIAVPIPGL